MRLQVKGKNLEVGPELQDFARGKLARLDRHLHDLTTIELELSVERNPSIADDQVAEATVWTKGPVLRARESSPDMRASIDLLVEKLERQARRYREKRTVGRRRQVVEPSAVVPPALEQPAATEPQHREDEALPGEADERRRGGPPARADRPRLLRLPQRGLGRRERRLPPPRRGRTG